MFQEIAISATKAKQVVSVHGVIRLIVHKEKKTWNCTVKGCMPAQTKLSLREIHQILNFASLICVYILRVVIVKITALSIVDI